MRLIDADELVEQIESPYTEYPIMIHLWRAIKDFIDSAPTIDAVEVVRCGECKWSDWYETSSGEHRCYCMEQGSSGHTDDDYCSYGEREGE